MPKAANGKVFNILIDGDVVVDHHIYRGCCDHPASGGEGTKILIQQGGAGLTHGLMKRLCNDDPQLQVHFAVPLDSRVSTSTPTEHHAYATWLPFRTTRKGADEDVRVWRVAETLGFGSPAPVEAPSDHQPPPPAASASDVLIIDEGGLGYRNREKDWPPVLAKNWKGQPPWIVLKMSHPICRDALWMHLSNEPYLDHLIVLVAADDLRRSGSSISRGMSWEQSVQELLSDLQFHPEVSQLARARHVVINFGHDGALWVDNSDRTKVRRQLFYDPGHLEGTWQDDLEGTVLGVGACLAASVARSLFEYQRNGDEKNKANERTKEVDLTDGADLGTGVARAQDWRGAGRS